RGFNKKPAHPAYQAEKGDIAVSAVLEFNDPDRGESQTAEPVFLIRGSQPFNFKDEVHDWGLHVRFTGIDPTTETLTVNLARKDLFNAPVPIEAAPAPRTDF
ncbi:hypothetical protein RZS08_64280, partial [Arthrospira platensis SPKY1]|nr:hypothetical protein [Arthrospira platensis SPKY1]